MSIIVANDYLMGQKCRHIIVKLSYVLREPYNKSNKKIKSNHFNHQKLLRD